jgi:hypothetical protein
VAVATQRKAATQPKANHETRGRPLKRSMGLWMAAASLQHEDMQPKVPVGSGTH